MKQAVNMVAVCMAVAAFVVLCSVVGGCYKSETNESPVGTVGKQIVKSAVETVTKARFDREVSERERVAAELAASEVARQQAEAVLELREAALAKRGEVERELRRELDGMKSDRRILHEHLDRLATANVAPDCPLGDARRIRTTLDWMRERTAAD